MHRFCVLSIPRTGSTWLTNGIGNTCSYFKNFINLGEFFTPLGNSKTSYHLNEEGMINYVTEEEVIKEPNFTDFISRRLDKILKGNTSQPLVLKYMYWTRFDTDTNDLENLQKIKNHNIKIININRNTFDSTISMLVSETTGINHRWINPQREWWTTTAGPVDEIPTPKITLSPLDFEITYLQFVQNNLEKERMANLLDCVTVNYDSLRMDCYKNKIPFQSVSRSKKIYDVDYNTIVENYDELLDIKNKLDATWKSDE